MASVTKRPGGSYWVQFVYRDKRHTIRLGRCPARHADAIKVRIEDLVYYASGGTSMDDGCLRWLNQIDDDLYERLATAGLVRSRAVRTLGGLLDHCFTHANVKPSTLLCWLKVRQDLVRHFGVDRPLRDITEGDAMEFRSKLDARYSPATVSKRFKQARGFFRVAIRKEWLYRNPFDGQSRCWVDANPSRNQYIEPSVVHKIMAQIPSAEWRLILALCRWGGLRCPSEVMALKWTDVNWDTNLMHVTSVKTERHEGKGHRFVPIFHELRPFLDDVWESAAGVYVIEQQRKSNQALRSDLLRFLRYAGVEPWPRLFQNLRASRETELADQYPIQVVAAWIGNSPKVALRHYLMVHEQHVARAVQGEAKCEAVGAQNNPAAGGCEAKCEAPERKETAT